MMKISNVRKPGRPAKTVGALLKQPSDLQKKKNCDILYCDESLNSEQLTTTELLPELATEPLIITKKKGRPKKNKSRNDDLEEQRFSKRLKNK